MATLLPSSLTSTRSFGLRVSRAVSAPWCSGLISSHIFGTFQNLEQWYKQVFANI